MAPLYLLSQAFKIWMLVDAFRRRPDPIWWFIILLVPFGEWVYFFVVKRQDLDLTHMRRTLIPERPPSIEQLRKQVAHSPSLASKAALAQGLVDSGETDEAVELFREVLARDDQDVRARHGLGRALLARKDHSEAARVLSGIVEADPRYAGGDAWVDLVEALWGEGEVDRAIEQQRALIRDTGRIDVTIDLAQRMRDLGRLEEARELIDHAVESHQFQPAFVKKRDRAWARRARALQRKLARAT